MSFYVTAIRNPGPRQRVAFLAGPFNRHGDAIAQVEPARREAYEVDSRTAFDVFGTTRDPRGRARLGKLNGRLGLTAEDLAGRSS